MEATKWVHHTFLQNVSVWKWTPRKDVSPLLKRIATIKESICHNKGSSDATPRVMARWSVNSSFRTDMAYDYFRAKGTKKA